MAHFAQIDTNNIVIEVLVVPEEQQHRGQDYLANDLMLGGTWVQTSYNSNIRKTFAGVGYFYHQELDIFLPPKPYPSWIINEINGEWESPIPRPEYQEGMVLIWDENTQNWIIEELPKLIIP
jgi:hypothetical protein